MFDMVRRRAFVALVLLSMVVTASAQTRRQSESFSINGYIGQANVVRSQGRALVDVEDLARITKGVLSFEEDRIVLSLAASDTSEPARDIAGKSGFSTTFMRAAIEAMASIREWGGMLQVIVENGYPVGKAVAGEWLRKLDPEQVRHS